MRLEAKMNETFTERYTHNKIDTQNRDRKREVNNKKKLGCICRMNSYISFQCRILLETGTDEVL